ncbi:hypothetical protein [Streptomyces malaysiensis]|uniref:hypothetical protein n=1 Tax=Streptomyces malaysiensis TaxID=92644 RepID=UPI0033EF4D6E
MPLAVPERSTGTGRGGAGVPPYDRSHGPAPARRAEAATAAAMAARTGGNAWLPFGLVTG